MNQYDQEGEPMTKSKVYITRAIPDEGLKIVMQNCETEIWPENLPIPRDVLLDKVRGINGLLCLLSDTIDAKVMDTAGNALKVISNYAVGYDNIDLGAATERGIIVCNTPGVLTETTADLAFALLMAAARRLGEGIEFVKMGKWKTWGPKLLLGQDIHNATLGIIGMGQIGSAVKKRAKGFNMNVIYYDPKHQPEKGQAVEAKLCNNLDELFTESDFISLHVPLTLKTKHLINADALKKMKNTAILINTSRGQVIDSNALIKALQTGEIAYAALDVTDPEPLPATHELMELPNCIVVPHIGSASTATRAKMAIIAAENLIAALAGQRPKHIVNPEVLKLDNE